MVRCQPKQPSSSPPRHKVISCCSKCPNHHPIITPKKGSHIWLHFHTCTKKLIKSRCWANWEVNQIIEWEWEYMHIKRDYLCQKDNKCFPMDYNSCSRSIYCKCFRCSGFSLTLLDLRCFLHVPCYCCWYRSFRFFTQLEKVPFSLQVNA